MGKLVIRHQGNVIAEVNLKLGNTTIGRKAGSDIVLNDAAVSGEHAVIKTVGVKSTIQDLDSTNGTFIDNKRVTSRELRHGDMIIIGAHELLYKDIVVLENAPSGSGPKPSKVTAEQEKTKVLTAFAQLLAMDGKDKGKRLPLIQNEVVLENPGKNPARIIRGPDGYVMHGSAGPGEPRVNDKPLPPGGTLLEHGDMIELAGTTYRFFK